MRFEFLPKEKKTKKEKEKKKEWYSKTICVFLFHSSY